MRSLSSKVRRPLRAFSLLVAGAVLVFAAQTLRAATPPPRVSGDTLLIKIRGGTTGPASDRLQALFKHTLHRRFDRFGWQQITLQPPDASAALLERYRAHPDVLAVERDASVLAIEDLPSAEFSTASSGDLPDDPLLPSQWALQRIGAPVAWLNQTGSSNIVVAVIDTGVNYYHEDLQDNLWRNPGEVPGNGIDDDSNGWVDDVFGVDTATGGNDADPFDRGANGFYHGSLIAGIIGASAGNRRGITGINWSVKVMAVRAIGANNVLTIGDEIEALHYLLIMKERGVNLRAVNMSYGGLPHSLAERDALKTLTDAGVLLCIAAGNSSTNNDVTPNYPASHPLPGIIAVAASDELDQLAVFPFSGSSQYGRTNVDLAAPGIDVASTFGPGPDDYDPEFFGTSAAAPHVAGAVALLAAANPAATPQQIKSAILESVDQSPALTNRMVSHGRLNLGRAIDHPFIANGPPTIPRPPQSQTVVLSNAVTFNPIAFGAHPRQAQWYLNGYLVHSNPSAALTIPRASFGDDGEYVLVITNPVGLATTSVARLTVVALAITNPPTADTVRLDNTARFIVGVSSPVPVTFQWRFNGRPITGATNAILTIPRAELNDDGYYSVAVANEFGDAVSDAVRLTVLVNPWITVAPISQSIVQGGAATFSVVLGGNPSPFGVQWLQGTTARASNVVESFQDFFALTNAQPGHAGTWRVRVRNAASANAAERAFIVQVLSDYDGDGLPDAWEKAYALRTNDVYDALMDSDEDGHSNLEEYIAGTNPTNALSGLTLAPLEITNGRIALSFVAASNRTYTVESRAEQGGFGWNRMMDVVADPTNRTVQLFETVNGPDGLRQYRVRTPRRP